ncbi:MAG: hypothetical protein M5R38_16355 [Candidatus Methylomirabilis sp.]|nr:hypothetical protein [Candidatus Methylomirabilis sp.]
MGGLSALILVTGVELSLAATVKITDSDLQPATVTVNRGEEVIWVDATTDQNAHVSLDFSSWQTGVRLSTSKEGDVRAKFEKSGTYGYSAHVTMLPEARGGAPFDLRGKVVVK